MIRIACLRHYGLLWKRTFPLSAGITRIKTAIRSKRAATLIDIDKCNCLVSLTLSIIVLNVCFIVSVSSPRRFQWFNFYEICINNRRNGSISLFVVFVCSFDSHFNANVYFIFYKINNQYGVEIIKLYLFDILYTHSNNMKSVTW